MSQKEPMEIYQENGLYGLKNDCGEVVISPQYRDFYSFSCGVACVRDVNYHYAYINYDNKPIVPFGRYVWIDPYFTCGYARVIQYSVIECMSRSLLNRLERFYLMFLSTVSLASFQYYLDCVVGRIFFQHYCRQ